MPEKLTATRDKKVSVTQVTLWPHGQQPVFCRETGTWNPDSEDWRRFVLPASHFTVAPGESCEVEIAPAGTMAENAALRAERNALAAWQCAECGARFGTAVEPREMLDGVTRCSSCVQAAALRARVEELEAVNRAASQMLEDNATTGGMSLDAYESIHTVLLTALAKGENDETAD